MEYEVGSQDKFYKYKLVFFTVFILISLFTTSKDILLYPYYIKIPATALFALVFLIFAFLIIVKCKFYYDIISIILLLRLIIYLLPLLYIKSIENYWGNYLAVLASFIAYFIASQSHISNKSDFTKKINNLVLIFSNVISIQVIFMYFIINRNGPVSTYLFKYYLVLPIGSSNYISCFILPLMIFVLYSTEINKIFKYISLLLSLLALLIIKSKTAIFVLIIFIAYKFLKKFILSIFQIKENKKSLIVLTCILIISLFCLVYFSLSYVLSKWKIDMKYSIDSIFEVLNALSSNRLNIYIKELTRWTEHFIFGNGLSYPLNYQRSHNWLIELLVQSGLIGFFVYLTALFVWYINIKNYIKNNHFIYALFNSIIIILLQGLAEVSIFTVTIDILLWFFIGLTISESNSMRLDKHYSMRHIYD